MSETKEKILNVAERLFSENGIAATSLRRIMSEAGVNPAAIHYHFGSREALVESLLKRRIQPLNEERLSRLRALQEQSSPDHPATDKILEAFIGPAISLSRDEDRGGPVFMKLMGRLYYEAGPQSQEIIMGLFEEVLSEFIDALRKSLPGIAPADFAWRFHYTVGSMAYLMADRSIAESLLAQAGLPIDDNHAMRELVRYATAGFHARNES